MRVVPIPTRARIRANFVKGRAVPFRASNCAAGNSEVPSRSSVRRQSVVLRVGVGVGPCLVSSFWRRLWRCFGPTTAKASEHEQGLKCWQYFRAAFAAKLGLPPLVGRSVATVGWPTRAPSHTHQCAKREREGGRGRGARERTGLRD